MSNPPAGVSVNPGTAVQVSSNQTAVLGAPGTTVASIKSSGGTALIVGDVLQAGAASTGTPGSGTAVIGFVALDGSGNFANNNTAPPVNHQLLSYTPVLADLPQSSGYQGVIRMDSTSANTLTIPPHSSVAYPSGAVIYAIQWNTGQTGFAAGAGVTIQNPSSLNCRARYSTIAAMQTDVTDTWVAMGDLA